MTPDTAVWITIAFAVIAANVPFLSQRLLLVGPRRAYKSFAWRLLEWSLLAAAALLLGKALEAYLGQRAPQRWEFYAAWVCLFATFAFPGFVWRYLRR